MLNINDVSRIYLGIQGENGARPIIIDVRPWLVAHPQGSFSIWHKRNGDANPSPTGAIFDDEEGTVTWTPTSTDTYVSGEGEAEIRMTENSVIKKTKKVITGVSPAVTLAGTTLGSDWASYINAVDGLRAAAVAAKEDAEDAQEAAEDAQEAAETAQEAAEDAQEAAEEARDKILGMTATATALNEGQNPTASYSDGVLSLGIPKGDHAAITTETEQYQQSNSGTTVPSGQWLDERPNLTQGKFLWIKRTRVWNGGETVVSYEAYYTPTDGDSPSIASDDEPTEGSQKLVRSGGTYTMIQTKAKKVTTATENNFAAFDSNGDLKDSGKKSSDFKPVQTAVTDPTASGTDVEFISGISQDAQGVITPAKKTVRTMTGAGASTAGETGLVPAPAAGDNGKYLRGDGTWDANLLTGKRLTAQTLSTGSTSVTFSDASITTSSTIVPFASIFGVVPTAITVTTGQAVVEFDAQQSDMSVYIEVW